MGRKLKLLTLDSIPPETNLKVKKAIKDGDHSLEAADAKLEYAMHQVQDLEHRFKRLEKTQASSSQNRQAVTVEMIEEFESTL